MVSRREFLAAPAVVAAIPRSAVVAEVRPWGGKPTLFVNGKPTYPAFYALTDALGGRWSFDELPSLAIQQFVKAGFRLFQVDLFLESVWPKPGPLNLDLARRQLGGILAHCPDAAIVIRWHLNPPRWWMKQHPEEWTRWANGDLETQDDRTQLAHCPDAAIVIRWHLNPPRWWMKQHPEEWTRWANGDLETQDDRTQPIRLLMDDLRRLPRVSLASRLWLGMAAEKTRELLHGLASTPEGNSLAGLHLACGVYGEWHYWGFMRNEPDVSAPMQAWFAEWRQAHGRPASPVPDLAKRTQLDDGIFRDPARREEVIDYYRAQQELVADRILHFCGTAKRAWPRKLLTGTFYGYFFSMFDRSATGGHLCLDRVLASPDVDYLSAPQAYGDAFRGLGGPGITRGLVESARLHNKLFLDEMDETPSWQWQNNVDTAFKLTDLDRDYAIIRRNVFTSYARGTGLWYYDFGPANAAGWWNERRLMDEITRLNALLTRYHQRPYVPAADVLFVFDTEVFYYTGSIAGSDPLTDPLAVNRTILSAWASGAALETIHLSDLSRVDLDRFRAVVFGNTWLLTSAQRRFIRDKVMAGGRHVVFQGAPGYCDGKTLDARFVRDVTGLPVRRFPGNGKWAPQFTVAEDGKVSRLGNTWFAPQPVNTPAGWRDIFRAAGAHLYVESGDIVHAGGGLVLVHTKAGGSRRILFRSGRVADVTMPPKSSWIFDAGSGERLV